MGAATAANSVFSRSDPSPGLGSRFSSVKEERGPMSYRHRSSKTPRSCSVQSPTAQAHTMSDSHRIDHGVPDAQFFRPISFTRGISPICKFCARYCGSRPRQFQPKRTRVRTRNHEPIHETGCASRKVPGGYRHRLFEDASRAEPTCNRHKADQHERSRNSITGQAM
jgi:hypothetical protein